MNIETLKVFKDLIETQSFTKTARMNYISQSAVSQQIKKLEMIFKTKLFIKRNDRFELTRVGKLLYEGAGDIIKTYDNTISRIRENFEDSKGEIKISSIYTVGIYLLNNYIRGFLSKYPNTKINLDYYEWDEVINKVLNDDCDFGFVACKKVNDINISSLHINDEEMVFVAPNSYQKPKGEKIDFNEAFKVSLIFFEKNTPSRKFVECVTKGKKVSFNVTMEMNNIETIKAAIMSNAGYSILPYTSVENDYKNGKLKIFRFSEPFYRPVYMVYNKRKKFSPPLSLFMNFMLNIKKNKTISYEEVYG
ncbi:MAG: LysR family transcriptional regulator [Elusimicrobiales bacterium]|nr:LysR family transcriptional regulator [Elusimicrobiales bacterium]